MIRAPVLFLALTISAGITAKEVRHASSDAEVWERHSLRESDAEVWESYSLVEKAMYLKGICEGLRVSDPEKLGAPFCSQEQRYSDRRIRFCFLGMSGHEVAIAYVDKFYRNKNKTDIQIWAVIGSYNDKSCNEDLVSSRLDKMQKAYACERQLMNMIIGNGFSEDAIKAREAECEKNFEALGKR